MRIIPFFSLFFIFTSASSYSQDNSNHLFAEGSKLYISAGHQGGKRIVSGIQVEAKDSTNQQIHVRMDLLKDWVACDSAEFDLFLDTTRQEFIYLDDRKYESIHYRSKDSQIQINFEKPKEFTYYNKDGTGKRSAWISTYAKVHYSNRFKKYNRILKMYFEK
jgi:hypothetical protein